MLTFSLEGLLYVSIKIYLIFREALGILLSYIFPLKRMIRANLNIIPHNIPNVCTVQYYIVRLGQYIMEKRKKNHKDNAAERGGPDLRANNEITKHFISII